MFTRNNHIYKKRGYKNDNCNRENKAPTKHGNQVETLDDIAGHVGISISDLDITNLVPDMACCLICMVKVIDFWTKPFKGFLLLKLFKMARVNFALHSRPVNP
jgi:hypothetical protein